MALGSALAAALLVCSATGAGEGLKSGPPVGSTKIAVFDPLHCTGPQTGTRACLV
jgi:hypothetical protein